MSLSYIVTTLTDALGPRTLVNGLEGCAMGRGLCAGSMELNTLESGRSTMRAARANSITQTVIFMREAGQTMLSAATVF